MLSLLLSQAGLPPLIYPAGSPTFQERFERLDAGPDRTQADATHRWRTLLAAGIGRSPDKRSFNDATLFVDPSFTGIKDGKAGATPLGLQPFRVTGSGLAITARRASAGLLPWLGGGTWTSGILTTKFSFSQLRGYFEMRANLPSCVKGAWPAFWLLPTSGAWPANGEIDAPETVGTGYLFWSTHSGAEPTTTQATRGTCVRGMHTYGVLWRKDQIGYYYDRRLVAWKKTPADFNTPMYMLVDLAMEGSWAGKADRGTRVVQMFVNRITVWQEQ